MQLTLYSKQVQFIQTLLLLVSVSSKASNKASRYFYYNNHKGYIHERTQPLTTPTPYWLWMVMVYPPWFHSHNIYILCGYRITASNQQTNNPKDGKIPSLRSQPESIIAFTTVTTWQAA